jgi:hypothetical protein
LLILNASPLASLRFYLDRSEKSRRPTSLLGDPALTANPRLLLLVERVAFAGIASVRADISTCFERIFIMKICALRVNSKGLTYG